ncbi:MAG: DUF4974 domain-containing protein [Flammeovirgaceae bacterium]|nr:DUF4974 domain-containing protein [Flammeovirgaceae bacterium]
MKEDFSHIDDLIGKYLAGEATPVEQEEVELWVAQHDENRKYFEQLKLIFEKSSAVQIPQQFDTDQAWIKLKERIDLSKSSRGVQLWPALRIAAGIVVVFTLGYYMYLQWSKPTVPLTFIAEQVVVRDTLPDGSHAVLNKNSSLSFTFHPRSKERKVKLEGEAFFEVAHEDEKPFIIETQDVFIKDIGTAFNVKAYAESETVEVVVESGEVIFYTAENPGLNLIAGEAGVYNRKDRSFSRLQRVDTNKLAYKTGYFTFQNMSLSSIIKELNEVYPDKIRLAHESLGSCSLNVSFNNEKLEVIVDIIAETLQLKITKEGNDYVLDGKGCNE